MLLSLVLYTKYSRSFFPFSVSLALLTVKRARNLSKHTSTYTTRVYIFYKVKIL